MIVNSTGDLGDSDVNDGVAWTGQNINGFREVTLRAAIQQANWTDGETQITFGIPENDAGYNNTTKLWTITPQIGLPVISEVAAINGQTQPGWTADPVIVIDGQNVAENLAGLEVYSQAAAGSSLYGLSIVNLKNAGVSLLNTSSVEVKNCWLGLSPAANGGNAYGAIVNNGFECVLNNLIVGNNTEAGVKIQGDNSHLNRIQSSKIGVGKDGQTVAANKIGVLITDQADYTTVGVVSNASEGNTIAGNTLDGIRISGAWTMENIVTGNYIGTNSVNSTTIGNGQNGVRIETGAFDNRIGTNGDGAYDALEQNIISGNGHNGVEISGEGTTTNSVAGNRIGTDKDGNVAVPNEQNGVFIEGSSYNRIGSDADGTRDDLEGNTIAHNGSDGVRVAATCTGNTILRNSIYANTGLGIDLGADGVTQNDFKDADNDANDLQNFPVIARMTTANGQTNIEGWFNSTPNASFRLEFYASDTGDNFTYGEGKTYLDFVDVTTDAMGNVSFSKQVSPTNTAITATATRILTGGFGGTSEFSSWDIDLDVDTNRDAVINYNDEEEEDVWSNSSGAIILANADDDDGDDLPDNWRGGDIDRNVATPDDPDTVINVGDLDDIGSLRISLFGVYSLPLSATITIAVDMIIGEDGYWMGAGINPEDRVRIFLPRTYNSDGNCVQDEGDEEIIGPSEGTTFVFHNDPGEDDDYSIFEGTGYVQLGIEGVRPGAPSQITVTLEIDGNIIMSDSVQVKVSPWVAFSHQQAVDMDGTPSDTVLVANIPGADPNGNNELRTALNNAFGGLVDEISAVEWFTPAAVEIGDTFTLTRNDVAGAPAISFVATDATVANVTAGLVAAWNASANPLITVITAVDRTTGLTLTANTPGVTFRVVSSTNNGGAINNQSLIGDEANEAWWQDIFEIGYVQAPYGQMHMILGLPRGGVRDWGSGNIYARETLMCDGIGLIPDFYYDAFDNQDDGGNFEVQPNGGMGRIVIGEAAGTMNANIIDFLRAQGVQDIIANLDLTWMALGHVDEVVSFHSVGQVRSRVSSPDVAWALLNIANLNGEGALMMLQGMNGGDRTVVEILNDNGGTTVRDDNFKAGGYSDSIHTITERLGLISPISNIIATGTPINTLRRVGYLDVYDNVYTYGDEIEWELRFTSDKAYDIWRRRVGMGAFVQDGQGTIDHDSLSNSNIVYIIRDWWDNTTDISVGDVIAFHTKPSPNMIEMPVLFRNAGGAIAYTNNVVNSIVHENTLLVADVFGPNAAPAVNSVDRFDTYVADAARLAGFTNIVLCQERYYHNGYGSIHCATNVFRLIPDEEEDKWWIRIN